MSGALKWKIVEVKKSYPGPSRGVEEHGETLSAALRVPDHAHATVACDGTIRQLILVACSFSLRHE